MRRLLPLLLLLLLLVPQGGEACFGPKLYLGIGSDEGAQRLLAEVVSLYVKEKTGTEMVLTPLAGLAPLEALQQEKVDLALSFAKSDEAVLTLPELELHLLSGERPRNDLQFTTVLPALAKLAQQLPTVDLTPFVAAVTAGEPAAGVARRLLRGQRWI